MSEFIQVQITFPGRQRAEELAELLVEQKLVACVQILGPMVSVYCWGGQMEKENEFLMLAKTEKDRFEALCEFVSDRHPYECPQLVAVPLTCLSAPYAEWLHQSLTGKTESADKTDSSDHSDRK